MQLNLAAGFDPQPAGLPATPDDYRHLAELFPHIIWVANPDGSTRYLNQLGCQYFGIDPAASRQFVWAARVHPEDLAKARSDWAAAVSLNCPYQGEGRVRGASGEYRRHSLRAVPITARAGGVDSWLATITDIEDQRQAETDRDHALTLLQTIQANAPVGLGFIDLDYRIVHINERMVQVNSYLDSACRLSAAEQVGRLVKEVLPTTWHAFEPLYRKVVETGQPIENLEFSSGGHHWLKSYYPVRINGLITGIGIVVLDITERKRAEAASLELTHAAVATIAAAAEARDPYTSGHQCRVSIIAAAIGRQLGLDSFTIEGIEVAASIHDIGKLSVPSDLLTRPGKLSGLEFALIKTHSQAGYDIMKSLHFPWPVADMIHQHHEHLDGSGYPLGLSGDQILFGSRIITVADVLEAMTSHRPYRPALGLEVAFAELAANRGKLFDADAVDACLALAAAGTLPLVDPLHPSATGPALTLVGNPIPILTTPSLTSIFAAR